MSVQMLLRAFHKPPTPFLLVVITGAALAWTPLALVSYALFLFVLSRLVGWKWGIWTNLVAAFLIMSAFLACLAGVAWLVKAPLSAPLILSICALALGLAAALHQPHKLPSLRPSRGDLQNTDDWLAWGTAVIAMIIVCLPLLPSPNTSTIAPLIMYGGDNSAHLKMVEVIDQNQGYSIGHHNRVNLTGILVAYPQGWHFVTAFVQGIINQTTSTAAHPGLILGLFYGMCVLWWGALIFLMARLSLLAANVLAKKTLIAFWARAIAVTVTLLGALCLLLSLFTYGFQTQIAALAFLLLELLCIVAVYEASSVRAKYTYLWLTGLVLAGSGFSWLFLYPISGVLLLVAAIHTLRATKKLPLPFLLGAAITAGFVLFQPLIQLLVKVPAYQDGVNIINQRGNVAETNLTWIIIACLAVLVYVYLRWQHRVLRLLLIGIATGLVFSLGLMWYQLGTIHELRYYYYKSTYTVILFATIALAAAVAQGSAYLMSATGPLRRRSWLQTSLVVAVFVTLAFCIVPLTKPTDWDGLTTKKLSGISSAQANVIVDIVHKQPQDAWRIISIGSCNRGDDIRATLLANALSVIPRGPAVRIPASIPLENIDKDILFKEISAFIDKDTSTPLSMIVLSNDQVIGQQLLAHLTPEQKQKIQLINLDPSIETETPTQCPDRLRSSTESAPLKVAH